MLSDTNISQRFSAEAVNIACYTQNRAMVNKKHEKTPYEIWKMSKSNVSYVHVFGCRQYADNNGKNHLSVFESKSDARIFLQYSAVSKALRIFNNKTFHIEESIHVVFEEMNNVFENYKIHNLSNRLKKIHLHVDNED